MSFDLLQGLRVVEVSSFVAAPWAGLCLSQLGAQVTRIDPPGGGIDAGRWPLGPDGESLYWQGLNRGKRSVALDLKSVDGQAALHALLQDGGADGGILLTNLTGPDWLTFERLQRVRADLVMVELRGHPDGSPAVDYTVNAALGIPDMTGGEAGTTPVNHVLPAWDGIAGATLATAVLAALRKRDRTGQGQHISVALSDVATAFVGALGWIADAELSGQDRPRHGNHLYGAFGHPLTSSDGRRVMVIALTTRHFAAIARASDTSAAMEAVADRTGQDLTTDAGRYLARAEILDVLQAWASTLDFAALCAALAAAGALWGPYRTITQWLAEDANASAANPLMHTVEGVHHGARTTGSPIRPSGAREAPPARDRPLGADTQAVLDTLQLPAELKARLKDTAR